MKMTMKDLQQVLAEQIMAVRSEGLSPEAKKDVYIQAEYIAKLSKQMINNADVNLRYEVALCAGKIDRSSIISEMIEGEANE